MDRQVSVVRTEPVYVDQCLSELNLDREKLLEVARAAFAAAADVSPFNTANAAGTFSYQYGILALRQQFVGKVWQVDRTDGVESIVDESAKIRIAFSNVDVACDLSHGPKPRSPKGAGSERVCSGNLFGYLDEYAPKPNDEYATFFLMMDESGALELTRPVISNRTYKTYIERNFISDGGELSTEFVIDTDDTADDFDPVVIRK